MATETQPTQNGWGPMVQVALEQRFAAPRRILDDPLAYPFLPAYLRILVAVAGSRPLREPLLGLVDRQVPGVRGGVLCRKRAIDDRLAEALGRGAAAVVDLGSGMDTRAGRVSSPVAVPFYAVDLPETNAALAAALRRACGGVPAPVRLVATDFERQDAAAALAAAGYTPGQRVFFIMEGVSQYITAAAVRCALEATRSAGPGSVLAFTYIRRDFLEGRALYGLEALYRLTRGKRETWRFGLEPDEITGFLAPFGWREVEQLGSAEYLERIVQPTGRDIPVMAVERLAVAAKM